MAIDGTWNINAQSPKCLLHTMLARNRRALHAGSTSETAGLGGNTEETPPKTVLPVRFYATGPSDPAWKSRLTTHDLHALTPLFWEHVNPYGCFDLDMHTRLDLS